MMTLDELCEICFRPIPDPTKCKICGSYIFSGFFASEMCKSCQFWAEATIKRLEVELIVELIW
jgi:hypothetical protein